MITDITNEEIIKRNDIISKFMDFEECPGDSFVSINYRLPDDFRKFMHCSHFGYLLFKDSWDWIMTVHIKIAKIMKDPLIQYFSIIFDIFDILCDKLCDGDGLDDVWWWVGEWIINYNEVKNG